LNIHNNASHQ